MVSLLLGFLGVCIGAVCTVWAVTAVERQRHFLQARIRQHRSVIALLDFLVLQRQRLESAEVTPTNHDYRYIGETGMHYAFLAKLQAIDIDVIDALQQTQHKLGELATYSYTEHLVEEVVMNLENVASETAQRAAGVKNRTYLSGLFT
ncbi:hypothetical protein [Corynebacterium freiburgense]|uniref:hypothetical protein n=1 Tax=Corynebacterium freiburgense TaxID=556548 RepID=UPI000412AAD5|nr:hypothetical protein [Corynebacterium freiburgense]